MAKQDDFTTVELQQLDRLVDGELDESERHALLASFDAHPDRWRRCALAFLEAQSWSQELSLLGRGPAISLAPGANTVAAPVAPESPIVVPAPRVTSRTSWAGLSLAMAATFLLAFGLAWTMRAPIRSTQHLADAPEVERNLSTLAVAPPIVEQNDGQGQDRWGSVTLVMDDGKNGEREVELPVVEEEGTPNDAWLTNAGPVVPRELRQAFERLGHRVDERRQLLPVQLNDGRQLIVPVDDVEFTPVSARSYQ